MKIMTKQLATSLRLRSNACLYAMEGRPPCRPADRTEAVPPGGCLKHKLRLMPLVLALLVMPMLTTAQTTPDLVNYQGFLTNDSGDPVSNGVYQVEFRIWSAQEDIGGDLIWGEKYNVVLTDGRFNILLGSGGVQVTSPVLPQVTSLSDAFEADTRFLGLTMLTDEMGLLIPSPEEIAPRQQFLTSPFAFKADHAGTADDADQAANADKLDNLNSSDLVQKTELVHGNGASPEVPVWNGSDFSVRSRITATSGGDVNLGKSSDRIDDLTVEAEEIRMNTLGQAWITATDDVEITATDRTIIRSSGYTILQGDVSMFGAMVDRNLNTSYTPDTDGYLMVFVHDRQIEIIIDGVDFHIETDEDPSGPENDNVSASFPVAKGEVYRVNNVEGSGPVTIKWRPIGLMVTPQS